jgi:cytochrome c-type biogenesis protein CcmE
MKISHIIAIIIIAITIGIFISTYENASQYVSFKEAFQMASDGDDDKVHVVGKLKKDSDGHIVGMEYNPTNDPNYFSFILVDNNKEEKTVVYFHPKPQDLEKSEQVVIVGNVKENVFVAKDILMKCPSKYENQEPKAGL